MSMAPSFFTCVPQTFTLAFTVLCFSLHALHQNGSCALNPESLYAIPGATAKSLTDHIVQFMMHETYSTEEELEAWHLRAWENPGAWEGLRTQNETEATIAGMPAGWLPLVKEGETCWMIERNAASAGFLCEEDYLRWRVDNESTEQD